ncbi:MAG: SGNH/GDSL hydrolase family protein [Eubacteriales bacterium]|nr:SGNH/GDSL hydrolase family protein [Eubacteriales bacterium]
METNRIRWCAIGDSFTYLNDHLDETGFRVRKGYLTRVLERFVNLELQNIGINGSRTGDWVGQEIPEADLYTVLLGTNDWFGEVPLGTQEAFAQRREGTILGNLAILLDHIRTRSPEAQILVMNPVERSDFIYLFDPFNNAPGSYAPYAGQTLSRIADGIYETCLGNGIPALDLHRLSGFTPQNAVRFKRVRTPEGYRDLPYPDYVGLPVRFGEDEYPYPEEAQGNTYDGLHPTDRGNEIIASLLAEKLEEMLGGRLVPAAPAGDAV